MKKKENKNRASFGTFPVLETPQGSLSQSNAICQYLTKMSKNLPRHFMGNDVIDQAKVLSFIEYSNDQIEPCVCAWTYQVFGHLESNEQMIIDSKKELKEVLKPLEDHLLQNTWLVGKFITLADIVLAIALLNGYRMVFDDKWRKSFVNLTRWFTTVVGQVQFRDIVGKVFLCAIEQKPLEVKKKQEPKKQEPKKEEVKKEEKKEENFEDLVPKKKANPLDLLPESTFIFDNYKKYWTNSTNLKEVLKKFWTIHDPKGYSIWHIKYDKYTGEGEVLYMTENLQKGFIQRFEHFRKYSLGVWGVYGDEPNLDIEGCWLWRGTEIPQELKEHPSFEYHFVTKLDHTKPKDRKFFED